jgi:hypothetical protein
MLAVLALGTEHSVSSVSYDPDALPCPAQVITGAKTTKVHIDKVGGKPTAQGVEFSLGGQFGERFSGEARCCWHSQAWLPGWMQRYFGPMLLISMPSCRG